LRQGGHFSNDQNEVRIPSVIGRPIGLI